MKRLHDFVHGSFFTTAILIVIALNAVLIGWESYRADPWVEALLAVCLWIFVAELGLKIVAAVGARQVRAFLADGWNLFDVVIVAAAFVPAVGPLAPILRVLRILRVFRLVRAVPELRVIVTVLLRSLVSMKYIALLGGIVLYIYAIIGVELFGPHQPAYASLHEACFTLFRVLTGDNWTDLRYAAEGQPWQWKSTAFHVSWIVVSTFLLINLIVGAVLNNYQEVQAIEARRLRPPVDASDERLRELVASLSELLREREARREA
ncbi:MAG: ion transporter [Phycisphaerae bacterium]|nr:ion transporter [Phycisphaerae bacterium]